MKMSTKLRAGIAGLVALGLVAGSASVANAAPGDEIKKPQSNGSNGSFYIWDGNTAEFAETPAGQAPRVWDRADQLVLSANAEDVLSEIIPADYVPQGAVWTQVMKFITPAGDLTKLNGGVNTWPAYDNDAAAGPNGGVLTSNFTLEGRGYANGTGIEGVFAAGGDYWAGIAFTNNQGVQVVGKVYRTVHIEAGTGKYTIDPVETVSAPVEVAPAITTQPAAKVVVEEGATATFTAAASGTPAPTVKWESNTGAGWTAVAGATDATLTVSAATLAQNGTQYRAVFTNAAGSATTNAANLTVHPTEPVSGDAGSVTIENPAEGVTTISVPVGAQYNGQQLAAWAWSTPTQLPNATVTDGVASVDISGLEPGEHTVAVINPATNDVLAWGTITVAQPTNVGETDLTVDVVTSNKFALEGVNAAVDLGEIKRGQTTVAKPLTPFTVTDDRSTLPGWNLTAAVDDFKNAAAGDDIIGKAALGLKPKQVGSAITGITTGAEQVAGQGIFTTLFAEAGENTSTGEAGTQFDADLTFAAPASAKPGTYTSKLTLTLTSK